MLICITMFNEEVSQFDNTLKAIYANLPYFNAIDVSEDEIAVIVMFDGIEKLHHTMFQLFETQDRLKSVKDHGNKTLNERHLIFKYPDHYNKTRQFPKNTLYMYQTKFQP